jgi:hypothetical protein
MKINLRYIDANPEDAELLSSVAFESKKFWGYSNELMNLWKDDLEISREYILKNNVIKVFDGNTFIGFFAIKQQNEKSAELDHLWLKPESIKKNYGRAIFSFIINDLSSNNIEKFILIAEPNAIGFYQKMNGKVVGEFQSKISGRFLDIYEFRISQATNH